MAISVGQAMHVLRAQNLPEVIRVYNLGIECDLDRFRGWQEETKELAARAGIRGVEVEWCGRCHSIV